MNRWTHRLRLGLAGFFLAAAGLTQDAVFEDEIDVRLIEIEVIVTDADGSPVTGLGRDDFEVRQGRKRLEVTHFMAYEDGREAVTGTARFGDAPDVTEPAPAAAERLFFIVYLDHAFLEPGELGDVVEALERFLRQGLRPEDRVLLIEANQTLEIVELFSSDHDQVAGKLRRLQPRPPRGRTMAEFPRLLQEVERVLQRGGDPWALKSELDVFADDVRRELEVTSRQLHYVIPAVAGLPGRKEILYVGGTLPVNAPQRLYNAWNTAFGRFSGSAASSGAEGENPIPGGFDNTVPQAAAGAGKTGDLFREVVDHANTKGVKLHVLDAGGLRQSDAYVTSAGTVMTERSGGGTSGTFVDASRRLGDPQLMRHLAESTGGRALVNNRDFESALFGVVSDLRTYYSLAFEPDSGGTELEQIRVKVQGRKGRLAVRHRQAYKSRGYERIAADTAMTAVTLGEADNPLGVRLVAEAPRPDPADENRVRLPVYVVFAVDELVWIPDPGGHRAQVSMYFTAGDFARGASPAQKTVVPLVFSDEQMRDAGGRDVEYKLEVPVPADSPRIAVTLRDDLRPLTSTAVLDLTAASR